LPSHKIRGRETQPSIYLLLHFPDSTSSISETGDYDLISTWTSSLTKLAKDIPLLSWSEFECDMQVAGRGTHGHKNKTNGE
jgi:hypothetical protein